MTPYHPTKGFSKQQFFGGVMAFLEKMLTQGR
jgi:hypothetical protein